MKVILLYMSLMVSLNAFGQKPKSLPLIISIDGDIPTSDIYKCHFLVKDSLNRVSDSIHFDYRVSQATVTERQYQRLKSLSSNSKLIIRFEYSPVKSVTNVPHTYECAINVSWINDVYIILKFHNYENKLNYAFFNKRKGYGVEIEIPGSASMLLSRVKQSIPW